MEDFDRISQLPDSVLHHIYSFLPFKQVVQTCVLSKRWHRGWGSYPVFKLDRTIFTRDLCHLRAVEGVDDKEVRRRRKKAFNYMEWIMRDRLCRRVMGMEKLTLEMDFLNNPDFVTFIDRCVCYAIGSNVNELKLRLTTLVHGLGNRGWYNLPQIVLFAKSVDVLELRGCKLELCRSIAKLPSLRKLCLVQVYVDDHVIKNIVAGCPLIEEMSFDECFGFKSLELVGHDRLHDIKIMNNSDLELMVIKESAVQFLAIMGAIALCEINIACCKNLKGLTLEGVSLKDEWLYSLLSSLPFLKYLEIGCSQDLERIMITSPSLERLLIYACFSLVELKIDTPNLGYFNYYGHMISFSSNALALSNIDVSFKTENFDTQWYVKYIELLAQFHHCSEMLNLEASTGEDVIVPKELRQILPSPLFGGKHVNLRVSTMHVPAPIAKIVDSLLWILPHTKAVSIKYGLVHSFEFEFTYKKQVIYEGESASCCKSLPVSCWQHCIEKVKLVITNENSREVNNTKRYFLKGTNMFEKINELCG
ncbi:hypothetical protein ACOSQ2_014255 [Xanthoceras sorbifolium]